MTTQRHEKESAHTGFAALLGNSHMGWLRQHIFVTMTVLEKEALDANFHAHIAETRKERAQYYKSRVKAMDAPEKYLSVIIDAMDQRKTCFPFFCNPPKNIANEHVLKLKIDWSHRPWDWKFHFLGYSTDWWWNKRYSGMPSTVVTLYI
jgi:hypothetical protein